MPLPRVTEEQFAAQIAAEINLRDNSADTTYGPIPDWSINPQARVLAQQSETSRVLSLQQSMDPTAFAEGSEDLNAMLFNEGIVPPDGSPTTATLTFFRNTAPTADLVIQRGFPVATTPDTASGASLTFVVAEARTLPVASASSYYNLERNRYEITVVATCATPGVSGRVGPNRIRRPLRPMSFDGVSNLAASTGGTDPMTNVEKVALYRVAIRGRQTGTPNGIVRAVLADFPGVRDVYPVYGNNPLLTRANDQAGAVDAYVITNTATQTVENITFYGLGQLMVPTTQPVVQILSVVSGANNYVEGVDYEVVLSALDGSVESTTGIRFIASTGSLALPTVGSAVTVTYTYDDTIRLLQAQFDEPDNLEIGRSLLFRMGIDVPFVLTANIKVASNFSQTTVIAAVRTALLNFFNVTLGLGDTVEVSDIQAVVRAVSGVDNFIITRLTPSTELVGTTDVPLEGNEYPTLASADLGLNPV